MKLCIAGKNDIAVSGLRYAMTRFRADELLVCPNKRDDGISRWQPSMRKFAAAREIQVVELEDLYQVSDLVFVSLEFDRLVRPERFSTQRLFNVHFSSLPAYKGMYTAAWPILNGEKASGVTLHRIDHGIDTGDIVDQLEIPILDHWTARDLYFACMSGGLELFRRNLDSIVTDNVEARPQSAAGSSYYSASSIDYGDLRLDLRSTAEFLVRQSRAFHFREFQVPEISGMPVCAGRITDSRSRVAPGKIIDRDPASIVVSTIDFDVLFAKDLSWEPFAIVRDNDAAEIAKFAEMPWVLDTSDAEGITPLILACRLGASETVRALLEAGANPNRADPEGKTPLMHAMDAGVACGDLSICKQLLDWGCDLEQRDIFENTVSDYARRSQATAAHRIFGTDQDS